MSSKLTITCKCGITWKMTPGKGKGSFTYNFQCDGAKGCKRYLSVHMEDDTVVSICKGSWYPSEWRKEC